MKFDHVALEVDDFDDRVRELVENCEMRLLRTGTRFSTGQRIAMLGDGTGTKLELIEADATTPTFAHLAFRSDDSAQETDRLTEAGWDVLRPPHRLDSAKAETALLATGSGLPIQVITYDADSPDDIRWDNTSTLGES